MNMAQFENLGINEGVESITELYNKIAVEAEKLVCESYRESGKKVKFPIDISLITKYLKIEVSRESLNMGGTFNYNRKLGMVTARNGQVHILVDGDVSYKTRRYAIANGVGRYLLNQSKDIFKSNFAIPLIPQSLEEIAADSIALFLLMPVTTFKEEFLFYLDDYVDRSERPLDVDEWLQYLSDKSQITLFNLAIGYQQMKQVLCYQRQEEFAKYDFDITKIPEDKYSKIFA